MVVRAMPAANTCSRENTPCCKRARAGNDPARYFVLICYQLTFRAAARAPPRPLRRQLPEKLAERARDHRVAVQPPDHVEQPSLTAIDVRLAVRGPPPDTAHDRRAYHVRQRPDRQRHVVPRRRREQRSAREVYTVERPVASVRIARPLRWRQRRAMRTHDVGRRGDLVEWCRR